MAWLICSQLLMQCLGWAADNCRVTNCFLIGQFVDVYVFHKVKTITGEKYIWARATGSTLASQFIDSFVVLFIAFYIGAGWDFT